MYIYIYTLYTQQTSQLLHTFEVEVECVWGLCFFILLFALVLKYIELKFRKTNKFGTQLTQILKERERDFILLHTHFPYSYFNNNNNNIKQNIEQWTHTHANIEPETGMLK